MTPLRDRFRFRRLAGITCVMALASACGEVTTQPPDAAPAADAIVDTPPPPPPPPTLRSCRELHEHDAALPSGEYLIDPDGKNGFEPAIAVR